MTSALRAALIASVLVSVCCSFGEDAAHDTVRVSAEHTTDGLTAHRPAVTGLNGLVTSGHPLASMSGMQILQRGGTAADAAVAVLATLNQVEPMMSVSWNASLPKTVLGTCPVIATMGMESILASIMPVMRFVAPGPEVARQTPTSPVARA